MTTNTDIHPIQSTILCELLFVKEAGFGELNKKKLSSDQFSFHLRQLADWKLIEKTAEGKYVLTTKGKEYANRFDTEMAEVERQPKLGVCVIGVKKEGEKVLYLSQQRLKQPYFGFWGFVTGKVRWGEKAEETALRELMEETGLKSKLTMVGLKHKMDFSQDGILLEDKYFLTFRADITSGEIIEKFEGGMNRWMTKEEILSQEDVFDDVEEIIEMVERNSFEFVEKQYKVKRY
jgi:ADP-ribose pyrophosphatase YjhB (NUDIX family)